MAGGFKQSLAGTHLSNFVSVEYMHGAFKQCDTVMKYRCKMFYGSKTSRHEYTYGYKKDRQT